MTKLLEKSKTLTRNDKVVKEQRNDKVVKEQC